SRHGLKAPTDPHHTACSETPKWARLVSNQRPLACEAVAPQARMGVVGHIWMCADARGYARMCALTRTRTALVPVSLSGSGPNRLLSSPRATQRAMLAFGGDVDRPRLGW